MTDTAERLSREARRLPPAERAALIDDLLSSLDQPDPNLDALWLREAQDRLEELRTGAVPAVSLEDVLAKHRPR